MRHPRYVIKARGVKTVGLVFEPYTLLQNKQEIRAHAETDLVFLLLKGQHGAFPSTVKCLFYLIKRDVNTFLDGESLIL